MGHVPAILMVAALLYGCAGTNSYEAEVIRGDSNSVSIKTGRGANPSSIASRHCAQYQRIAILTDMRPVRGTPDAQAVYVYHCR